MSPPAVPSVSKIVSLNARGGARSPGWRIFSECRELMLDQLCQWLRDTVTCVSDELFALADATRERVQQTRYLDLRSVIEKDWEPLVENFRREYATAVEREQKPPSSPAAPTNEPLELPDFAGLQLVDDADLSEHIVIREFAATLGESCADELYTLERRVAALLGHDEASDKTNPLAPPVLCQALSEACATIVADSESRLLLLRRLQRHLHTALPTIYQQVNAYLIKRGVLPELKRSYRRSVGGEAVSASPAGLPAPSYASLSDSLLATPLAPSSALVAGEDGPLSGESILLALQRLAQARGERARASLDGQTGGSVASDVAPTDTAAVDRLLLAALDELQHAPISAADQPIVNRVRELRDSQSVHLASALESVTIDIIAMLFDFIFDDAHIPVAIKALVSRLQIPVLKVAMLNPAFFADRQHPARRFLGSISGVSIRWGDSVDESDPFFRKLAELVERIQNEFASDIGVFGTALSELEAFVAERQSEDEESAKSTTLLVALHERQSDARERAQHAIRALCQDARPPALLTGFFERRWIDVLQAAALADDDRETAWQAATQAMRDLAWSVAPKKSSAERLRLITLLPGMLAFLKHGLISVNNTDEQCNAFLDALLPYHAAALRGEPAPPNAAVEVDAADTATPPPSSDGDLRVTRSVDQGIEVEEVMLVGASPIWRADDQEIYRQVGELKRGDWVEFDETEESGERQPAHRERLNWISPRRGILLFSNHQSAKAISIHPDALARKIRDGKARIVHPQAIFERALSGAIESASALDN